MPLHELIVLVNTTRGVPVGSTRIIISDGTHALAIAEVEKNAKIGSYSVFPIDLGDIEPTEGPAGQD